MCIRFEERNNEAGRAARFGAGPQVREWFSYLVVSFNRLRYRAQTYGSCCPLCCGPQRPSDYKTVSRATHLARRSVGSDRKGTQITNNIQSKKSKKGKKKKIDTGPRGIFSRGNLLSAIRLRRMHIYRRRGYPGHIYRRMEKKKKKN